MGSGVVAMIAVCLLTCDRPEMTILAASSFHKYHQARTDLVLLHCDGGSITTENVDIASAYGYLTLVAPPRHQRIGQMATLRYFVEEAVLVKCDWILWLENDWEAVAPIPSEDFLNDSEAETVRLFGTRKMQTGPRQMAGARRIHTHALIDWQPVSPGWEEAYAHWGAGGTLIQTAVLLRQLHQPRLKDVIIAENNLLSWRPVENLMWCHGIETTAGVIG